VTRTTLLFGLLWAAFLPLVESALAESVAVRYTEGLVHGFLQLRGPDGRVIADGDLTQTPRGDRITSKIVFRFQDGSRHEETVVFSQRRQFRLLTDHVVQKGPSFPRPLDFSIDTRTRRVRMRYTDDGEETVVDEQMDLPPDLANGMIAVLLKNLPTGAGTVKLPIVAATSKPRLVRLEVTRAGEEAFSAGRTTHKAAHFVLKVEIGGVKGLIAPLVGKQPPDNHAWVLPGDAPTFVRSLAPLYADGPLWYIELTSPVWPRGER
jgi:hypothetical protein